MNGGKSNNENKQLNKSYQLLLMGEILSYIPFACWSILMFLYWVCFAFVIKKKNTKGHFILKKMQKGFGTSEEGKYPHPLVRIGKEMFQEPQNFCKWRGEGQPAAGPTSQANKDVECWAEQSGSSQMQDKLFPLRSLNVGSYRDLWADEKHDQNSVSKALKRE